jgi:PAS domain S-box-containing protein
MESTDDKYFHQLCDSLGFICIGVGPDLRIRYWNRQAADHFGKSSREISGQSIMDIIESPEREATEQAFRNCLETRTPHDVEIKFRGAAPDPATFVLIISPILNERGDCIGASAAMRDISQRKRMSRELAFSRRMASLGKMAGGVAHHFNNILGGMMTSIDYALPSDSPRELRKTLRLLAQAIGRATRITKQLAAFAESENVLAEGATDLNSLMDRFLQRLGGQCQQAGVKLVSRIDPVASGPYEIQRLLPVLESLAQNATEAMAGSGTLTVEMRRDANDAVITIGDTGTGISDEAMEHLFEPFFTTKGELGGGCTDNIGLGLAAVHGLVSEMGGTIRIASKLGQGTVVTLRLPLRRDAGDRQPSPVSKTLATAT